MKLKNILFILLVWVLILGIVGIGLISIAGRRHREPIAVETDSKKLVALTFDDGPDPLYTMQVLDVLYENQAPATFFVNGKNLADNKMLLEQIVGDGHELANHTYQHLDLTTLSKSEIICEIEQTQTDLEQILPGYTLQYVRPPYGSYNDEVCEATSQPVVLWDIDSLDWELRDADAIYSIVMDNIQDGSIIVFHDNNPATTKALALIIPELIQRGFQPVTLTQLYQLDQALDS